VSGRRRTTGLAPGPSDAVRGNRRFWQSISAPYERKHERALSVHGGRAWGLWRIPEDELRLLGPTGGRRVLELGCGAGRWSIGLRRGGASPVGIDLSSAHLAHAAASMRAARIRFPLLIADAEHLPFRDRSFDIVFCDWGALSFSDPYQSIPEAARVLRPGGVLAFSTASALRFVSHDVRTDRIGRKLVRDYFGLHRIDLPDSEVDFTLPYGEWIRLFRAHGLAIERLLEPQGGPGRPSTYLTSSERAWSARYPLEIIWGLRKDGSEPDGKSHPRPRSGRRHG
jgi:SAM-dependent methyltransferase